MSDTPIKIEIDGRTGEFPAGTKIIEAAKQMGIAIPHFCYHKCLTIEGSCRQCVVEIKDSPKLQLSCATPVQEGMVIYTNTEQVKKARSNVLEFLLLNHPIDCPICDKAGECPLQDYYYAHSAKDSRLTFNKWSKGKRKDIGAEITLDQERCVLCGRCVRFMDEIAGESVLGRFTRGSHTELDCMPGLRFDNRYSMNTVDICPVGALTAKDFRFKKRSWFLSHTDSVCHNCSTNCTMKVHHENKNVYRLVPVENEKINSQWMCNEGRLSYHQREGQRFLSPMHKTGDTHQDLSFDEAISVYKTRFIGKEKTAGKTVIVASWHLTNEEAWLTLKLADQIKATGVVFLHNEAGILGTTDHDEFLLSADKSPNREGVHRIISSMRTVKCHEEQAALDFLSKTDFDSVILVGPDFTNVLSEELVTKLTAVWSMSISWHHTTFTASSDLILTGAHFLEKCGTLINHNGILQKMQNAVPLPGNGREEAWVLSDLLAVSGWKNDFQTVDDVFTAMKDSVPTFKKITYKTIPVGGVKL
jgi:NADH-quinone oxidoreductase subunit G